MPVPQKIDAPSGTTRELAEELATISQNHLGVSLLKTPMAPKRHAEQPSTEHKFIPYACQAIPSPLKQFSAYPMSA